jgi:sortase A
LLGSGGWIQAKAQLAQWLLQRAWQESRQHKAPVKPWPWADTWPVARLSVASLDVDLLVLNGDQGSSLAFGPGLVRSADAHLTIISGHRDTHFTFLAKLHRGHELALETRTGRQQYRVIATAVVDSRHTRIGTVDDERLVLVTCYPFDHWQAGGPLRYVVEAEPISL